MPFIINTRNTSTNCALLLILLCHFASGTPCLSFDIVPDNLGNSRETFPHTCYMVCGTQAEKKNKNGLIVMKVISIFNSSFCSSMLFDLIYSNYCSYRIFVKRWKKKKMKMIRPTAVAKKSSMLMAWMRKPQSWTRLRYLILVALTEFELVFFMCKNSY